MLKQQQLSQGGISLNSHTEELYPISQKILRFAGTAIHDFNMIMPNDRIMIGISGGKDSLLLALALATLLRRSPAKFGLAACLVDQTDGVMETDKVAAYMDALEIPLKIINHPTYKIIDIRGERSPCSLCANMRRGILANAAKESECNVMALGHHKDDAVETVLLNMFYGGRFKCYHPNLYMSRTDIRVIRPFAYVGEKRITTEALRLSLPIVSACCPYDAGSKRAAAKEILAKLEESIPEIKSNVIHALMHLSADESWVKKSQP